MKDKMTNKTLSTIFIFAILVSLTGVVSAFAVGSPVELTETNTLMLAKGESKELIYYIQLSGNEGSQVSVEIQEGVNVISIIGGNIVPISPNTPTQIKFNVAVPQSANNGDNYNVALVFKSVSDDSSSTVGVGTSIRKTFSVNVGQPVAQPVLGELDSTSNIIMWVIIGVVVVIILAIIAYILMRRKN